jgi:hypothetical protein
MKFPKKWAKFGFLVFLVVSSSAIAQDTYSVGSPQIGPPGFTESVSEIMTREAASAAPHQTGVHQPKRRLVRGPNDLLPNPASPAVSQWPPGDGAFTRVPATPGAGAFTPQTVGTSFLGAQISDTIGYVPPDSMADVGTNQIVVCVNGRIRSFSKNGVADGALDSTTDNLFSSVLHGSSTSDPRVRFDRLTGRWFITMITVATPNFVLIAVSSGPVISSASSFTFFSFQADPSNFGDYDTLGIDANALYIGVNVFSANTFQNTTAFVVNKTNLFNGVLTVTTFANLIVTTTGHGPPSKHGPYTPQGVNNDNPSATEGYFIGVDDGATGTLAVRRILNPAGTPSISGNILVTVPATGNPLGGVPALGSTVNLDDLDTRLFGARMHNGSLWTAHNIQVDSSGVANSGGGRDGARWYQLTNMTSTPTLVQSGTLFDSAGSNPRNFWIPSVAMSGQGHMALGCSVAGNNEHAEIAVAGRLTSDTPGTIQSPTTAVTSTSNYNINDGSTPHRWGDFSVTTVDPSDDMTMWTVQEYCNANNSWGVQVIKLQAPPPALPTNCLPASVDQGATVNVTVQGSQVNGSGFFDPGTGFPNHIAAAVSGIGVTVNSVTYNSPSSITLSLTAATNAQTGARTITVTNPDGQTATSTSGILAIAAVATNQPPIITALLTNQSVECGSNTTYTSAASGTLPLNYLWSVDGTQVPGTTNSSLALTNVHLPNHTIMLVVTNLYGSSTSNVVLTVHDTLAPVVTLNGGNPIFVELGSAFVDPGATASDLCAGSLSVAVGGTVNTNAVGTNTLTYSASDGNGNTNTTTRTIVVQDTTPPTILQSFTNLVLAATTNCSAAMPDVTGTNFILATDLSGALTISQTPTNNAALPLGTNIVVLSVTDASGNAAFSTNTIFVQDQTPPLIISQPQSQTNFVGFTATFSIGAIACTPLSFQWFSNTVALVMETNSVLTLSNLTLTAAGNYSVIASASGGSTTSTVAILTVNLNSTSVALSSSANPSGYNDNLNFTATITPTKACGTIQFQTNGVEFDTGLLVGGQAASTNIAELPRGTNLITAIYSGDANYLPSTNSLEQIVTNHPPIAGAAFYSRAAGGSLNIAVADLATNWTDVDGDSVTLADFSVSTNGVTLTNNAGTLVYFNTNDVADQFSCTISDGFGGTNFQTVNIAVVFPYITSVTANPDGSFTLNLTGEPNDTYVLETTTNLTSFANWIPAATNTLGADGTWQFTDLQATNVPQQFYRLRFAPSSP